MELGARSVTGLVVGCLFLLGAVIELISELR